MHHQAHFIEALALSHEVVFAWCTIFYIATAGKDVWLGLLTIPDDVLLLFLTTNGIHHMFWIDLGLLLLYCSSCDLCPSSAKTTTTTRTTTTING